MAAVIACAKQTFSGIKFLPIAASTNRITIWTPPSTLAARASIHTSANLAEATTEKKPDNLWRKKWQEYNRPGNQTEELRALGKEPHMIHMVKRVKCLRGKQYWEKEMMKKLGLIKRHHWVLHKNIPSVNHMLWKVKHLIEVTPVTFKHGVPSSDDLENTVISDNGEVVIRRRLRADPASETAPLLAHGGAAAAATTQSGLQANGTHHPQPARPNTDS